MKKSLILIYLIVICSISFGQYTITQNLGSPSTLVKNPNYGGFQGGLIPYSFTDTSAASAALTYLKTYNGALIYTTSDSALYFRCCGANKWQQILPSGGTNGQHAWLVNGNTAFSSTIPPTIGTKGLSGIGTITNNTLRYTVPAVGIVNNNGAGVKVLGVDTSDATLPLVYTSGGSSASGWNLTGNAGTTAGTNFIGTTDNVGLMFKTNNIQSGYIDLVNSNTSLGVQTLVSNTSGTDNSVFGYQSLIDNTSGSFNTAMGKQAISSNSSGISNSAFGHSALLTNQTGDANIGIGYNAGRYTGIGNSNRLFINSINRSDEEGDTTRSIIYGVQDATAANQRLYLNSKVYAPYIPSGVGSFAVRYDTTTKEFTYADTTSGGDTPALTATQIAFGDGSNLMTSSNNLLWDNSTKTMTLDSNTFNKNTYTMLGHPSTNIPTLIQMRRNGGSAPLFWGAIGAGGSTEINQFNNLDYRTSSHLYYDSTKNAIWTYLGYTNGFGIQFVPKDNPNNDIFNLYGKEIFSVDLSLQPSTGVAKRFMSQINSAGINIVDRGGTRYTNSANDTKLYVENASIYLTGGTGVSRFFSTGNLRISPDGYNTYADATAISTFTDSANSTYSIYENKGNNTNYNRFRYIKTLASSYNIGAGQKIIETDYNGGVAYDGVRATSTVTGGFSNAEFYWKTTNTAGVNAERMTLSEDGNLGLGTVTPNQKLHVVGTPRFVTGNEGLSKVWTSDANGVGDWATASSGGIIVGTTTISSGTSGRIGYNNAGVYNEYTTTGTGTEVVKSTSPTINADITLTGAYANLNINANTATNSFVSLGVNGTIYGYYGASGNTNAFITGSAVGDMCFRGVNDNILFSTNNGTSSQMTIKSTGVVQMSNYGAGTATFDASGNISSVSDERLKTAIKPYTSGLKQLLLLKPIQYKWNEKSGNETKETYAGFSAQNVKSAIPYGTGENKDGYLSLQERAIVATLVNAVKEQQQQIEELKREIIKLQNK